VRYLTALAELNLATACEILDILRPTTPEHRAHIRRCRADWEVTVAEVKVGVVSLDVLDAEIAAG
jgi:hypothetical protein